MIQHSYLNRVRGSKGILFNVVDNNEITIEQGMIIFDVFHPKQGRLRFKFGIGEEKGDKKLWWQGIIHNNPMSLEELNKLMEGVSKDEIRKTKERFIKASSPVEELAKGIIISIAGSARAGKNSIGERIAQLLGARFVDRGSIYRAITYKVLDKGISFHDEVSIINLIETTKLSLEGKRVILDGIDVTDRLRSEDIEKEVSDLWQISEEIEQKLVDLIDVIVNRLTKEGIVVITGRSKYPKAFIDFFITASAEERAKRELRYSGVPLTRINIEREKTKILERNGRDRIEYKTNADTILIENYDIEESVNTIISHINDRFNEYLVSLSTGQVLPIKELNLSPYYQPDLPFKKYSPEEIVQLIINRTDELARTIDVSTVGGKLEYYLLIQRRNYFIDEVISNTDSRMYKALVGMMGVAPYIIEQICHPEGINVFLARDAGRDYTAAFILDKLGILPNNSVIFHLSRKNMGVAYGVMSAIGNKYYYSTFNSREEFMNRLYRAFIDAMETNVAFREKSKEIYNQLKEIGIVHNKRIRFIDSWAAGTILYYLVCLVKFFEEYEAVGNELVIRARPRRELVVDCYAADAKTYIVPFNDIIEHSELYEKVNSWWEPVRITATRRQNQNVSKLTTIPSVDWQSTSLSLEKIRDWYASRELSPPPLNDQEDFVNFSMLMSAQLFKEHNPYGALNLGHNVDWNKTLGSLCIGSAAKRLGAYLRDILLMNSIHDYIKNEGKNVGEITDFSLKGNNSIANASCSFYLVKMRMLDDGSRDICLLNFRVN